MLGIIDCLTSFDAKKQSEYVLKKMRYFEQTEEQYWGVSCVPPDQYAERFKGFMCAKIKTSMASKKSATSAISVGPMDQIEEESDDQVLTDDAKLADTTWKNLKQTGGMAKDYKEKLWFKNLND